MKDIKDVIDGDFEDKKTARLFSYLTDSIIYYNEDEEKYKITDRKDLKNLIKKEYNSGNYLNADTILKSAKELKEGDKQARKILSKVSSKSLRINSEKYLKIYLEAYREGISIADYIRKILFPYIGKCIDKLSGLKKINENKISTVKSILDDWKNRKPTSIKNTTLLYEDIIKESSYSDKEIIDAYNRIIFEIKKQHFKEKGLSEKNSTELSEKLKIQSIPNVEITTQEKYFYVDSVFSILFEGKDPRGVSIDNLKEELEENKNSKNKDLVHKEIFNEIFQSYNEFLEEFIFSKDLEYLTNNPRREKLDRDIKDNFYAMLEQNIGIKKINKDQVQREYEEAIESEDIKKAEKLNRKLSLNQSIEILSGLYSDVINSFLEESKVITFTLPSVFLQLLDSFEINLKEVVLD